MKYIYVLISGLVCFSLSAMQNNDFGTTSTSFASKKEATIDRVAPLLQLAQLYAGSGPLANSQKAKELYVHVAAYKKVTQNR